LGTAIPKLCWRTGKFDGLNAIPGRGQPGLVGQPPTCAPSPAQRRGRPPLDVGRIITVAPKIVDEVGVQAFSLRMLADALESGTATLYRHFASKDELMAYVVDRVDLAARAFAALGHYVVGFAVQQYGPGSVGLDLIIKGLEQGHDLMTRRGSFTRLRPDG
jgi:AcrR family transcriptional regulator